MPYFCLIDLSCSDVPHMEFLEADDLSAAHAETRVLMLEHATAIAGRVFDGEEQIASTARVCRAERGAAAGRK